MTRPTTTLEALKRRALRLMLKGLLTEYVNLIAREAPRALQARA